MWTEFYICGESRYSYLGGVTGNLKVLDKINFLQKMGELNTGDVSALTPWLRRFLVCDSGFSCRSTFFRGGKAIRCSRKTLSAVWWGRKALNRWQVDLMVILHGELALWIGFCLGSWEPCISLRKLGSFLAMRIVLLFEPILISDCLDFGID